jgi:hypothetical protein
VIDITKDSMTSLEADKPTTASIVVDRILAEAVSDELKCNREHG